MVGCSFPVRVKLKLVEEERIGSADCDLGSVVVMITREKPYLPLFSQ